MTSVIKPLMVMKFGGAALANPENIIRTTKIIKKYSESYRVVVVVSAIKNVTDSLLEIGENLKLEKSDETLEKIEILYQKHLKFLERIGNPVLACETKQEIKLLFDLLELFIKRVDQAHIANSQIDFIVSLGERLSARIIVSYLRNLKVNASLMDTRDFLTTTAQHGGAKPIIKKSKKLISQNINNYLKSKVIPVITGYIAQDETGCITTLGRGGSDYTASLIANFINAQSLVLWKDVDGLYDKNPKIYPEAKIIFQATYQEAIKLSRGGAKILHPESVRPAQKARIPIYIKSFLKPDLEGTKIS